MTSQATQTKFPVANPTRTNASTNAYDAVLEFLKSRPDNDVYWSPVMMANELGLNPSTVRGACRQLYYDHKVHAMPKGKITLYYAVDRFTDQFTRLMKILPGAKRFLVHGISLKLTANALKTDALFNTLPQGGGGAVTERGWGGVGGDGSGETTFELSKKTLMVYTSNSFAPFDYDGWLLWLQRVDGYLLGKGYPRLLGDNLQYWELTQLGINIDGMKSQVNNFTESVMLTAFDGFFAQVYDKKMLNGDVVTRQEVHINNAEPLLKILETLSGNMRGVMLNNKVEGATDAIENNSGMLRVQHKKLSDIEKKVDAIVKGGGKGMLDDGAFAELAYKVDKLQSTIAQMRDREHNKLDALAEATGVLVDGVQTALERVPEQKKEVVSSAPMPSPEKVVIRYVS